MRKKLFYFAVLATVAFISCQDQEMLPASDNNLAEQSVLPYEETSQAVSAQLAEYVALHGNLMTQSGVQSRADEESKSIKNVVTVYGEDGNEAFYAVNYTEDGGFMIVSATRNYHPVLAIVDQGEFVSMEQLPGGVKEYLENYKSTIAYLNDAPADSVESYRREWIAYESQQLSVGTHSTNLSSDVTAYINQCVEDWILEGYTVSPLNQNRFGLPEDAYQGVIRTAAWYAKRSDYMETTYLLQKSRPTQTQVGPLLTTCWHQNSPYNYYIKNKYNVDYPAGCVPIALAQLTKYYQKPQTYDWDAMPNVASIVSNNYQEVARLVFDIAEELKVNYGTEGTGASIEDALDWLKKHGYSSARKISHNSQEIQYQLLVGKRPVYMRGKTVETNKGHAWICDGCRQIHYDYGVYIMVLSNSTPLSFSKYGSGVKTAESSTTYHYHMNWGWNQYNGWFTGEDVSTGNGTLSVERKEIVDVY